MFEDKLIATLHNTFNQVVKNNYYLRKLETQKSFEKRCRSIDLYLCTGKTVLKRNGIVGPMDYFVGN